MGPFIQQQSDTAGASRWLPVLVGAVIAGLILGLLPGAATARPPDYPPDPADPVLTDSRFDAASSLAGLRPVRRVGSKSFGIHSFQTRPQIPASTTRLVCTPRWKDVNPRPGVFVWDEMDSWIEKMEGFGYSDIVFAFCGTPAWAAHPDVAQPGDHYYGYLSNAPPRRARDFVNYVRKVAKRYRGRISAYEVWNEATSRYLWQGSPKQAAKLTSAAAKAIRSADPKALVIGFNAQTYRADWLDAFLPAYLRQLKKRRWPVDVLSVHSYTYKTMRERTDNLAKAMSIIRAANPPARIKIWDTETNTVRTWKPRQSKAVVARAFLESARLGIDRTYWYMWTTGPEEFLGVEVLPGSPGKRAYRKIHSWIAGAQIRSCRVRDGVASCNFAKAGKSFAIHWAVRKSGKRKLNGSTQWCSFAGRCKTVSGTRTVGWIPVRTQRAR